MQSTITDIYINATTCTAITNHKLHWQDIHCIIRQKRTIKDTANIVHTMNANNRQVVTANGNCTKDKHRHKMPVTLPKMVTPMYYCTGHCVVAGLNLYSAAKK